MNSSPYAVELGFSPYHDGRYPHEIVFLLSGGGEVLMHLSVVDFEALMNHFVPSNKPHHTRPKTPRAKSTQSYQIMIRNQWPQTFSFVGLRRDHNNKKRLIRLTLKTDQVLGFVEYGASFI